VHVRVYVEFAVSAPVDCVPEVAVEPDHTPLAVHDVALVEDHVSVVEAPEVIDVLAASRATVGAAGGGVPVPTLTVTERCVVPPLPVQLNV
jgi:hypothetical protein